MGGCVEVERVEFHKSSFSAVGGCVEVGRDGDRVLVRDTKDRTIPALEFTVQEWLDFINGVKAGEFD